MRRRDLSYFFTVFAVMAFCATGCQNTLRVRVEKVAGVSSISANSDLGRQLRGVIQGLNAIIGSSESARFSVDQFVQRIEDQDKRLSVDGQMEKYREVLGLMIQRAQELRQECVGLLGLSVDPVADATQVQPFLDKVATFATTMRMDILENARTLRRHPPTAKYAPNEVEKAALDNLIETVAARMEVTGASLRQSAERARAGFGRFYSTDVYSINPSDPGFTRIFDQRARCSYQPITEAKVEIAGDSSIMMVMEQPGQVRVYQVSNDPTQLASNVALLVSKATAAGAKYMTGGVAP